MVLAETRKQRILAFIDAALPVSIFILFFTNPFAKVVASITTSVCLILFLIRFFLLKDIRLQERAMTYYVIMFIYFATLAVSIAYSPDSFDGLRRFFSQTKILMALILIETVRSHSDARKYLYTGAAGGSILAFLTLYEGIIKHLERPPAMWNPVHGGNILMFSAVVVIMLLIYEEKPLNKVLFAVLLVVHGVALYLNGTRGAWFAMGSMMAALPFFVSNLKITGKIAYLGGLLCLVVVLFLTPFGKAKIQYTIEDIRQSANVKTDRSYGGRYEMWLASSRMFMEQPVLGVGLGGWQTSLKEMVARKEVSRAVLEYNQAHSIYLDVLSTRGIIGFAAFIGLVGYPAYIAWNSKEHSKELYRTLVLVTTIGLLIAGLTDTLVYIRGVFMSYILLAGLGLSALFQRSA